MITMKKGEKRKLAIDLSRGNSGTIVFDVANPPVFQVRIYPYVSVTNVVFPDVSGIPSPESADYWDSASKTGQQIYTSLDTEADWAIPGMLYRVYFKMGVTNQDDSSETLKGYITFTISD